MIQTPEEIEKELEELNIQKEEAEKRYKEALAVGFKKHKECCSDVCNVIDQSMFKLNSNITKANKIIEKTISKKIKRDLSKDITAAESKLKELKTLKEELYAKQVCNCKRR